jgi:hypothetical protein
MVIVIAQYTMVSWYPGGHSPDRPDGLAIKIMPPDGYS